MNPHVTVIIPAYNEERFIAEALESVISQNYEPFDIVVSDDGSTDRTVEIARSFAGVEVLALEHAGVSHTRNVAIRQAKGEWLAFLDADDVWLPGKLAAQVAAVRAKPTAGICFTHLLFDVAQPAPAWYRGPEDGTVRLGFEPSTWLVRKDLFDRVGYFDQQRSLAEDTDWLARLNDAGVEQVIVTDCLVRRRIHGKNASGNIPGAKQAIVQLLRESVSRKKAADEAAP